MPTEEPEEEEEMMSHNIGSTARSLKKTTMFHNGGAVESTSSFIPTVRDHASLTSSHLNLPSMSHEYPPMIRWTFS